jgi:hypothetical protein
MFASSVVQSELRTLCLKLGLGEGERGSEEQRFSHYYSHAIGKLVQDCSGLDTPATIRGPMATPRPLLARRLNTPDLAKIVQQLP